MLVWRKCLQALRLNKIAVGLLVWVLLVHLHTTNNQP
jgi:hypothetical protein